MSEPVPTNRTAIHRQGPAVEQPIVLSVGAGVTITITPLAKSLTTKEIKNALERGVRLAGKAVTAGLDTSAFLVLLDTLAEAERLERAAHEAAARVDTILDGSRAAPETAPELLSMSSP